MSYRISLPSIALMALMIGCAARRPNLIESGAVHIAPSSTSSACATYVAQAGDDVVISGRAMLNDPGPHRRESRPHVHVEIASATGVVERTFHAPLQVGPTTRRHWSNLAYFILREPLALRDDAVVRVYLTTDDHDNL